jgi:ATP-dependent RNA helicase DDX10/DBP4
MGAPGITGRTRPTKVKKQASAQKRKRDDVDVEKLERAVADLVWRWQSCCVMRAC